MIERTKHYVHIDEINFYICMSNNDLMSILSRHLKSEISVNVNIIEIVT